MSFSDFIRNFSFPSPTAFLESCSRDDLNMGCIVDLLFFPVVATLILSGIILFAYMWTWITYSLFFDLVYINFLAPMLGHTAKLKKMGQWAVITGATDGIGKAYAEELARLGINVVVISRTQSKLEELAKDIEDQFKVMTKIIAVDFSRLDIYDKLREELKDLEIGVLVNNVGMSYEYPEYYLDIPNREEVVQSLVNCNIMSTLQMTQIILPGMLQRHRGVILNLSSTSAVYPTPFLTVYSSTKVCIDYFSRGLQNEYRSKGIIIQSVLPFFVATKMSKIKRTSLFVLSPTDYVRRQMKTIGLEDRTFGCFAHKFQGFCTEFMVHFFPRRITDKIMYGILKDMNRRAHISMTKNKNE